MLPAIRPRQTSIGLILSQRRRERRIRSIPCSGNLCSTWRRLTKPKLLKCMKIKLTVFSLISVGAFAIAFAHEHTDKGHVASKHILTLQGAKLVAETAAKYAKDNDAAPSIA